MTYGPGSAQISLDAILEAFGLATYQVQVLDPLHPVFNAQRPLLILAPQFEEALPLVGKRYPASHTAHVLFDGTVRHVSTNELPQDSEAWLIDAITYEQDIRTASALRAIMARLYGPEGCPWDGEQTHESLRSYLIEESYETVEAIDRSDLDGLREELGDLLMQIVFHTTIAETSGEFTFEDVLESINSKMLRRHPHVFAGEQVKDSSEVWTRWEAIKAQERAATGTDNSAVSSLISVPRTLPALQRAQTLIGRVERAKGSTDQPPLEALMSALQALDTDVKAPSAELFGSLLWATVRYARSLELDAESVLREQANRFIENTAERNATTP